MKGGRLRPVITPDGDQGSIRVHQDVRVYAGLFDGAETATLELGADRHAYVHVARGSIDVNGVRPGRGVMAWRCASAVGGIRRWRRCRSVGLT